MAARVAVDVADDDTKKPEESTQAGSESWDFAKRPIPTGGGPTEIRCCLVIQDLKIEGDKSGETLHVDIVLLCKWYDPRLANWPKKEKPIPEETWRPEFYLGSPLAIKKDAAKAGLTFPHVDNPKGEVEWRVCFEHITLNLTANDFWRLNVFPYDSTRIDFFVCMAGDLRSESIDEVKPIFNPEVTWAKTAVHAMVKCGSHFGEHALARLSYALATHASPRKPEHVYPDVIFSLHIGRDPTFYHYKAFGPLWTVCALGFMSYASDVEQLDARMQVVLAMFLSVVKICRGILLPYRLSVLHSPQLYTSSYGMGLDSHFLSALLQSLVV